MHEDDLAELSCWANWAWTVASGRYAGFLAAQQAGSTRVIVPLRHAGEAKLVAGIEVFGIASITQLVALLQGPPVSCWPKVDRSRRTRCTRAGKQVRPQSASCSRGWLSCAFPSLMPNAATELARGASSDALTSAWRPTLSPMGRPTA